MVAIIVHVTIRHSDGRIDPFRRKRILIRGTSVETRVVSAVADSPVADSSVADSPVADSPVADLRQGLRGVEFVRSAA